MSTQIQGFSLYSYYLLTVPSIMVQSTKVTPVSDGVIILELIDLYDSRGGYYFIFSWREADILTKKLREDMPPNNIKVWVCYRFSQYPLKHTNSHNTIVVPLQAHTAE